MLSKCPLYSEGVFYGESLRGNTILENSKHSRCIYTRRFLIKETLPLIEEMLVGKSPKPSSFTKGRNADGKQNATKSDTLLRLRR